MEHLGVFCIRLFYEYYCCCCWFFEFDYLDVIIHQFHFEKFDFRKCFLGKKQMLIVIPIGVGFVKRAAINGERSWIRKEE